MDTSWVSIALPAGLIGTFLLYKHARETKPGEARALVDAGAQLVDVRSPAEFQSGHIDGAVNIPLNELGAKSARLGEKDRPVVLYCASGTRSLVGRTMLKRQGFTHVFNLGPMSRW
jgi:phage shock protein E